MKSQSFDLSLEGRLKGIGVSMTLEPIFPTWGIRGNALRVVPEDRREFFGTLAKAAYRPNYFLPTSYNEGFSNRGKHCHCLKGVCDKRTKSCLPDPGAREKLILQKRHMELMLTDGRLDRWTTN